MKRLLLSLLAGAAAVALIPSLALADDSGSDSGPEVYAKFVQGAQVQNGLFNLIRKDGKVYIELAPAQLDQDFIQTAEQANGLGGYGNIPGGINSYARIIRFSKSDDKVVVTWPNTFYMTQGNDAAARAASQTFANSPVGVAPIVAADATSGHIVIDASFLLGDIYDMSAQLKQITGPDNPDQAYHLDTDRTLFGPTKAFPENVIVDVDQTWASDNPQTVDNVPDPRWLAFRIVYNIAQTPNDGDYMPRIADDRVGFFDSPYLNFGSDANYTRVVRYIVRWNMQPSDPTKPMSPAKHPMIYYLSNTIPEIYRDPVRRALLSWNAAFEKIGISDAIQVRDQPDDPNWDPDDIRYNTVIWMTESNGGGYAAENPVYDPRTGQMIRTNIVIDADVMNYSNVSWQDQTQPIDALGSMRYPQSERYYAQGLARQAAFGKIALDLMGKPLQGDSLQHYNDDLLQSFLVHESGHGFGLQHNFIAYLAYSAKDLQSVAFTSKYGVATSVMAYAGLNLWPKGYGQGTYWQTALGPYDYFAIHFGYARIPGARTPEDELPTLHRWASDWTNPLHRFASDEDVSFGNAHAVDPRVAQFEFTGDPLAWDEVQLKLAHDLLAGLDSRWPKPGHPYDEERAAFGFILGQWLGTVTHPEHYIGGEYLSRSHAGDPNPEPPLMPVPRQEELRAFGLLDRYLFSESAWSFNPATLDRTIYSEFEPLTGGSWTYNPTPRHDIPVAEIAEGAQKFELDTMFQPLMVQRIDDLSLKSKPGQTMSLTDLFDWTQASVFGDLRDPKLAQIGLVHRSLQQWYARKLVAIWLTPEPGMPYDGQSMARDELVNLRADLQTALRRSALDELTRAHLESLQDVVTRALDARQTFALR